jgi:hypothetical protein
MCLLEVPGITRSPQEDCSSTVTFDKSSGLGDWFELQDGSVRHVTGIAASADFSWGPGNIDDRGHLWAAHLTRERKIPMATALSQARMINLMDDMRMSGETVARGTSRTRRPGDGAPEAID